MIKITPASCLLKHSLIQPNFSQKMWLHSAVSDSQEYNEQAKDLRSDANSVSQSYQ